jgi:hypothetical protein
MNQKVKMLHMSSLAMAIGLYLITAVPAASQQTRNCGSHTQVVERLISTYVESRQSLGLDVNNALIEVFASSDKGGPRLSQ